MLADLDGEDAGTELIMAMLVVLRASAALTAALGGANKIFDRVPTDEHTGDPLVPHPYISLGPSTSIPDDYDCMDGEEITIQWDVWTSGPGDSYGSKQNRKISNLVKRALHNNELALTNNALVSLECELVRITDDPNPAIGHGVVQFTAVVETPNVAETS